MARPARIGVPRFQSLTLTLTAIMAATLLVVTQPDEVALATTGTFANPIIPADTGLQA